MKFLPIDSINMHTGVLKNPEVCNAIAQIASGLGFLSIVGPKYASFGLSHGSRKVILKVLPNHTKLSGMIIVITSDKMYNLNYGFYLN